MLYRLVIFIALISAVRGGWAASSPLRISEFMAAGRQGLLDEDGESPDWIEIQNVSAGAIDLSGWTVADESRRRAEWRFPATNIPAGGFLVIFASGKNRRVPGNSLHTDFKLDADGGSIRLRSATESGSAIENYPPQVAGVSFGVSGEGTNLSLANYIYLESPTPGRSNAAPVTLGPHIYALNHRPQHLSNPEEPILVTAKVSPANDVKVTLRYRVMFGGEVELTMRDDGQSNDGAAGDGVFGANIPAGVAKAGEMIRYCVLAQDAAGQSSRWPLFASRRGYSAYQGTMVADPSIQSRLPVIHLFSNARDFSSAALFYAGELHDNVAFSPHGQISRDFPKPSFNLDFPANHHFRYRTNEPRVSDLKILGNFADKSKIRNTLAYEMIAASGSAGHFAFPVRIQVNGQFFCVAEVVEDGDDRWLERVGLDPEGALYKIYSPLQSHPEAEKKTRKHEDHRDLSTFVSAISGRRTLAQRAAYAYRQVDLPQCASYFVAMTLISSGDHGHKNYYLYRDTRGSGEWALLPWDVDLSWGRNWTGQYFDDRMYGDNPLNLYRAGHGEKARNPLYDLFFEHPEFRQMYLRRLRTVMDELLQAPGTPPDSLIIEKQIRAWMDRIDPADIQESDADLDTTGRPSWGAARSARAEAQRIIAQHLPGRRKFLFENRRATLYGDPIPPSQPADASLQFLAIQTEGSIPEQFVCITNQNNFAVDISGWKLTGAGIEHQFRPGTVIPASKALYVVSDIRAFRRRPTRTAPAEFAQGNWKGNLQSEGQLQLTTARGRIAASGKL